MNKNKKKKKKKKKKKREETGKQSSPKTPTKGH
jgi:hypothetical protein